MDGHSAAARRNQPRPSHCESDVILTRELLRPLLPKIIDESKGFGQALLRGRYMQAVARMERIGVPIDVETLHGNSCALGTAQATPHRRDR